MSRLESIASVPDQKQKIEQYKAVLVTVFDSGSREECQELINHSKISIRTRDGL